MGNLYHLQEHGRSYGWLRFEISGMYLMRVDRDLAQEPDFRDQLIEIIQHITPPERDDTMSIAD